MTYNEILTKIATQENTSKKEIEKEMQAAITAAGYDCSVSEFIFDISECIKKTIYSNIV